MLSTPFKNYDEFKELFGWQEHNNGVKSRKNKILLSFFKCKKVREWIKTRDDQGLALITNMQSLKIACLSRMTEQKALQTDFKAMCLHNRVWRSNLYSTDHMCGRTVDGDNMSIRYVKTDVGRVYKMRASKMYAHLIGVSEFGRCLPIQVSNWLVEELTQEWCGWNISQDYELHINECFADIYDSDMCEGDFHSCMTNKGYHIFYELAVKAKAAYLTNSDEKIVARAIIFCDVEDEDNNKYNLLERQYSTNGDDVLKQILVNKLIEAGAIDGYKKVGAGCHDSKLFVSNSGEDWSNKTFSIPCFLEDGDTLSYQDSFKYFNSRDGYAYNRCSVDYDSELDDTSGEYRAPDDDDNRTEYDDYHGCYVEDVTTVYYHGRQMTCDSSNLEDFVWIMDEGDYYHIDDVQECPYCGRYYVSEHGCYSELLETCFCSDYCANIEEGKYFQSHSEKDLCYETV